MSLPSRLRSLTNWAFAPWDVVIDRLSRTTPARRARFLHDLQITTVLDVGAHVGEYAQELRRFGYNGRIESFEPLPAAFQRLQDRSAGDQRWHCHQLALSDNAGAVELRVAGNEVSSSLLPMLRRHVEAAPGSAQGDTVQVATARLHDLALIGHDRTSLKIDTQGYERHVLDGAAESLANVLLIEIELSLEPLYEGAPDYRTMIDYLAARGFQLVWLQRGFEDARTGELLQCDGFFRRQ